MEELIRKQEPEWQDAKCDPVSWSKKHGSLDMTSFDDFSAFAASRGEGLHPKLRELFERTIAVPLSAVTVRTDGMLQAGPNPGSKKLESQNTPISSPRETYAETAEMEEAAR